MTLKRKPWEKMSADEKLETLKADSVSSRDLARVGGRV
jgi:hypothetical protein